MTARSRPVTRHFNRISGWLVRCTSAMVKLALAAEIACALAIAQTPNTTISGIVYDPRGPAGLPLPNVLVYATTNPVSPLPSGVQCLTYQAPTGVVSFAYTAVDGTFTLGNIPEGSTYTLVIQAGKWRRQYPGEVVGSTPLTGLTLSMPADHTQGDIPMIAIATGSVDGVECVLRDMGISDTEFTDDNGTVNPGGHIHLYRGAGNSGLAGGAVINSSTPSETSLTGGTGSELNNYDMLMFPCQGGLYVQQSAPLTNLLNYADAGGRIFTTHYSYVYLDPNSPTYAQFPPVANWTTAGEQSINTGVGTVATNFSDGATLAQWLQNSGATVTGTPNQIQIGTLRTDVSSVIPPTQSWVTLNSGTYNSQSGNPVMQMTFNTPVGAPAANQCGRVMYNDYHVYNFTTSDSGATFPNECPNPATHTMSAQEKMLEYALFDLSTFVQPVVVPTLSLEFNPSPLAVKSGDTSDQVIVSVTNTSATTQIDSSAILKFAMPPQVTVTAIADSTGGWNCTVATLTCTRNSSLGAGFTDSVTLTLSVGSYTTLASYTGKLTATVSSVTFSSDVSASDSVIYQQIPQISWATPTPIVYGMPLTATQLDATSPIAGTFTYSPAAGTVLPVGQQTLNVTFTPTDMTDYGTATAAVTLIVIPATPVVTLRASADPVFLNNAVSFTASLPVYASSQTGMMTFYDGSTQIGTATVSGGSGTLTTTALSAGVHYITAAYSGDSNYGAGVSGAVAETVQDFTLAFAAGSSSASAPAGGQAEYSLVVTPVGGATLPAAVNLNVTQVPLGATATFSPATVAVNSGATTVTLQLRLPAKAAIEPPRGFFSRTRMTVALGLLLLPFAGKWRKSRTQFIRSVALAIVSAALTLGFTACGSTKFSPQNLSFTVTASSGALSHSVAAQLTVK